MEQINCLHIAGNAYTLGLREGCLMCSIIFSRLNEIYLIYCSVIVMYAIKIQKKT